MEAEKYFRTFMWLLGLASLTAGCGALWGYGASLVVFGAVILLWPVLKSAVGYD